MKDCPSLEGWAAIKVQSTQPIHLQQQHQSPSWEKKEDSDTIEEILEFNKVYLVISVRFLFLE